jgi:hypothetical protein
LRREPGQSGAINLFECWREEILASEDRGIIRWQLRWSESEADRGSRVNIMRIRDRKVVEGLGYVKG